MAHLHSLTRDIRLRITDVSEQVVDLVYPPNAPDIGALRLLDDPCCMRCGFPFEFSLKYADVECGACTAHPPRYDRARAAFAYDDVSQDMVLNFKHGGVTANLNVFALQMLRAGREMISRADGFVPVPLHASRLRKRRFNQSALLAGRLSKLTSVPVSDCLKRTRKTQSQGKKSALARKRNVQGAFIAIGNVPHRCILIDDVMTTGATVEACALALRRAGAEQVDVLTLTRVVREQEV